MSDKQTNKIDDGGPAFPGIEDQPVTDNDGGIRWASQYGYKPSSGMTLRDYFAAKAMQGLLACGQAVPNVSSTAYQYADAMLAARKAVQA